VPRPFNAATSPYSVTEPAPNVTFFSVVENVSGELAGEALLWNIDTHNRGAMLGLALRPSFRGRGLSTDVLRVLCLYGFETRGLHRLQLDTLADNEPMIKAAKRAGFELEGTLRRSAWVDGRFYDRVILARLALGHSEL
jgi:RimJ/RimL family protein N-acetyltransferase